MNDCVFSYNIEKCTQTRCDLVQTEISRFNNKTRNTMHITFEHSGTPEDLFKNKNACDVLYNNYSKPDWYTNFTVVFNAFKALIYDNDYTETAASMDVLVKIAKKTFSDISPCSMNNYEEYDQIFTMMEYMLSLYHYYKQELYKLDVVTKDDEYHPNKYRTFLNNFTMLIAACDVSVNGEYPISYDNSSYLATCMGTRPFAFNMLAYLSYAYKRLYGVGLITSSLCDIYGVYKILLGTGSSLLPTGYITFDSISDKSIKDMLEIVPNMYINRGDTVSTCVISGGIEDNALRKRFVSVLFSVMKECYDTELFPMYVRVLVQLLTRSDSKSFLPNAYADRLINIVLDKLDKAREHDIKIPSPINETIWHWQNSDKSEPSVPLFESATPGVWMSSALTDNLVLTPSGHIFYTKDNRYDVRVCEVKTSDTFDTSLRVTLPKSLSERNRGDPLLNIRLLIKTLEESKTKSCILETPYWLHFTLGVLKALGGYMACDFQVSTLERLYELEKAHIHIVNECANTNPIYWLTDFVNQDVADNQKRTSFEKSIGKDLKIKMFKEAALAFANQDLIYLSEPFNANQDKRLFPNEDVLLGITKDCGILIPHLYGWFNTPKACGRYLEILDNYRKAEGKTKAGDNKKAQKVRTLYDIILPTNVTKIIRQIIGNGYITGNAAMKYGIPMLVEDIVDNEVYASISSCISGFCELSFDRNSDEGIQELSNSLVHLCKDGRENNVKEFTVVIAVLKEVVQCNRTNAKLCSSLQHAISYVETLHRLM